jgi:hypothetical protein
LPVEAKLLPSLEKFTIHAYAETLSPSGYGILRLMGITALGFFKYHRLRNVHAYLGVFVFQRKLKKKKQ